MREVCRELEALAAGRTSAGAAEAPADTLAVTGFANLTGRAEDAWLGTALAETLTAGLASLPGATVVSRERIVEAARALRLADGGEGGHAVRIGRELQAARVVSGAFQRRAEQVRVTATVTEVAAGRVTHTVKLDGTLAGIFELQDGLLARLAPALQEATAGGALHAADETHSLEAYEAFAKGLVNLQAESQESLDRAVAFFEQAIALDPGYARAHAQLGAALDVKGDYLGLRAISEHAVAALERALALRPDFAEAWRQKGAALITLGRDEEALAAFERALALDPTQGAAHSGIGRVHFVLRGDFARAVPAFERALALNPRAGWTALQLANCAAYLRDFPRAERAARRAVELQQALLSGRAGLVIVGGFVRLGQCHALQGRHAEALTEFERELDFLRSVDHALRARIFIELQQRIGEARLRLGDAAAAHAALDLALEAYERRLRSGAADAATPYYAACAHALARGARAGPLRPRGGGGQPPPPHRGARRARACPGAPARRAALPRAARGRAAARAPEGDERRHQPLRSDRAVALVDPLRQQRHGRPLARARSGPSPSRSGRARSRSGSRTAGRAPASPIPAASRSAGGCRPLRGRGRRTPCRAPSRRARPKGSPRAPRGRRARARAAAPRRPRAPSRSTSSHHRLGPHPGVELVAR